MTVLTEDEFHDFETSIDTIMELDTGSFGVCRRLQRQDLDLVEKKFINSTTEFDTARCYVKEVKYLCRVKGVPGMQQIVMVCPELNLHISEYAGETLYVVIMNKRRISK